MTASALELSPRESQGAFRAKTGSTDFHLLLAQEQYHQALEYLSSPGHPCEGLDGRKVIQLLLDRDTRGNPQAIELLDKLLEMFPSQLNKELVTRAIQRNFPYALHFVKRHCDKLPGAEKAELFTHIAKNSQSLCARSPLKVFLPKQICRRHSDGRLLEIFRNFIKHVNLSECRFAQNQNALHILVGQQNDSALLILQQEATDYCRQHMDEQDGQERTPLFLAALKGYSFGIQTLLGLGADYAMSAKGVPCNRRSPLVRAAFQGDFVIVDPYFAEHKEAEILRRREQGICELLTGKGLQKAMEVMQKYSINPSDFNQKYDSIIIRTLEKMGWLGSSFEFVRFLGKNGFDLTEKNESGISIFDLFSQQNSSRGVIFLLKIQSQIPLRLGSAIFDVFLQKEWTDAIIYLLLKHPEVVPDEMFLRSAFQKMNYRLITRLGQIESIKRAYAEHGSDNDGGGW